VVRDCTDSISAYQSVVIKALSTAENISGGFFLSSRGGSLTEEGQPAIGAFHFAEDLREIGHGAGGTFE
jgi:hypothetical protein